MPRRKADKNLETAAYDFVRSLLPKADINNTFPLWHGWALREAFEAGAKWQREQHVQHLQSSLAKYREHVKNIPSK